MQNFDGLGLKKIANLYFLALSPTSLKKLMLSPIALNSVKRCRRQRKNFCNATGGNAKKLLPPTAI
jgi:hypothetical protein